jgi:hypothetical protein
VIVQGHKKGNEALKLKKLALVFIVVTVVAGLFFSFLSSGRLVSARRAKSGLVSAPLDRGVYADSECTHVLKLIDWGQLSAGQSVSRIFYVKNLGKFPMELSLTTTNWIPAAANEALTLTWNREGTKLLADQVTMATLTLTVSSEENGITTFEMDTIVIGTKLPPR